MHKELFQTITFGGMQSYGPVAALPVSTPVRLEALDFLTLSEAVELMLLRIEEVSEGGSVPNLRVISTASVPVLLVSGEEVKGAKQNRILNTSILIPARASMMIPVSCTERGRWSYTSPDFKDSGNFGSRDVRRAANESVSYSLSLGRGHDSDQGKIWDKIEELHGKSDSDRHSRTRAMDDAFQAKKPDLDEAVRCFSLIPGQTGILFFHEGRAAGLDLLSRPGAYARLHDKLVKSYVIDGLDGRKNGHTEELLLREAHHFIEKAAGSQVKIFPSPGLGDDHRLHSRSFQGSILVYEKEAIHTCCFRNDAEEERMAGYNRRRKL